ncbi:TPA: hypothetical protein DDW69_03130 [candidate division CPR2 bacterium]|uniref:Type II secretion system protein GspG C-terminal domain-containing protein n=1 Tax=candidate division CPR2 bacterium GW2011_GWC1_41_48 TaxID=1618344 RepID=A0A0G0Z7Y0_UNCC2|nr:MAG: hypothetical protein UT47_C0003G0179 [candidate division CPR2 bacterium GW2011_GWC2_39_35]KKR27672.1 MAG: hypothetical protein UT60_C0041G0010 [candidate division CPR2 bacterium GW2011_GWD2_39_7]KKS09118.1 MAG: hypothetical protein UU65_C0003G0173 [candidate division CPR2 bacterium GW2011_GWC1_41_48]OGB71642.1 MAG: hypothetical protein A2Y26_01360 [candidate division CPR2 bacterium GWD2_39_7]HBG81810.1 hypothetical protein [candidate division CPR2 bacterium]
MFQKLSKDNLIAKIMLVTVVGVFFIALIAIRLNGVAVDTRNKVRSDDLDKIKNVIETYKSRHGKFVNGRRSLTKGQAEGNSGVFYGKDSSSNFPSSYLPTEDFPTDPSDSSYYVVEVTNANNGEYVLFAPKMEKK